MSKQISILGSTGSIGVNALKVVKHLSDELEVKYLTAAQNAQLLIEQALRFHPSAVAILDHVCADEVKNRFIGSGIEVLEGREGILEIASRDDVDVMLNALVGSAGMEPTVKAIHAGINVALSNKESMVMAGDIINRLKNRKNVDIFPVDSEHSAIWQCLTGEKTNQVRKIILTGSGGPFRSKPLTEFSTITVKEALHHPNWKMGKKITIDSATMMNKGLEVIEAYWLFGLQTDQIDIVIHPQSIIHSMVEFVDGSIKAQLGIPDMKIPIQYALTYPERRSSTWVNTDFPLIQTLTFEPPDKEKFPCIQLAFEALEMGGSAPAALSIANDNSVRHFLRGMISFTQISRINEKVLKLHEWEAHPDLEYLRELERWGKEFVEEQIGERIII